MRQILGMLQVMATVTVTVTVMDVVGAGAEAVTMEECGKTLPLDRSICRERTQGTRLGFPVFYVMCIKIIVSIAYELSRDFNFCRQKCLL
ncbi:hypothetical protein JCM17380_02000 [Desulfosporosinus burensis]